MSRKYDLILLGATGYTGRLCAEHITKSLPTDLKWAVSGRSHERLSALVEEIKSYNPDRIQPAVEVTTLSIEELRSLVQKTRLLLNTVGPYFRYSSPVVQACAENGTHYLDVTGEVPWVYEMIQKYHDMAKTNGAIIIPEIGIESAPSDLLAWSLATLIKEKFSSSTKEVVASVHEMRAQPSGGSLATVVGLLDNYGLGEVAKASAPWALSPIPGPKSTAKIPLQTKLLGIRQNEHLGTLTTSITAHPNVAIVQRTWGLLGGPRSYGPNFQYREYMRAKNSFAGVIMHFALRLGVLALAIPPLRWLIQYAAHTYFAPGQGASREDADQESFELRAIAETDEDLSLPKKAMAKFRYDGSLYYLTGILLAEAAMVLLKDDELTKKLGGGLLTPAVLGQPFIDRLRNAGIILESRIMPEQ
ncbi:MAG: hypothetical protein LQ338_000292 [Usnochroma carphineum]|nr:MAG: hypothetical protein LQ338_000292 [Usnochroma carphineum]